MKQKFLSVCKTEIDRYEEQYTNTNTQEIHLDTMIAPIEKFFEKFSTLPGTHVEVDMNKKLLKILFKGICTDRTEFVEQSAMLDMRKYLDSWQLDRQDNSPLMSTYDSFEDTREASVEMKKLAFKPTVSPLGDATDRVVVGRKLL